MDEKEMLAEDISAEEEQEKEREKELEALRAALGEAQRENALLRRKSACAELGVPPELAEDIVTLGEVYAERDGVPFETAVQAVCKRFGGLMRARCITTGVMSEAAHGSDALRKAFGLH